MARKVRLTRPELKRQRDALARFVRYLPMLKLKQQQLQMTIQEVDRQHRQAQDEVQAVERRMAPYRCVLADTAGIDVHGLARPEKVVTHEENIAGVRIPVLDSVSFPPADYSLFGTPPWVDRLLADLRELARRKARADVLRQQRELLSVALTRVIQRVNLFEKVLIPRARENIRLIRIHLGEEQTAAVGRAKLAKAKLRRESARAVSAAGAGEGQA